jgi:hypothetical protein
MTDLQIIDRDTGDTVATVDASDQRINVKAQTSNAERYLPAGELTVFAGSEPSADTALVDETERSAETKDEYMTAVRGRLAGTPLDVYDVSGTDAQLATRYSEGDEVETPDGVGVVIDVFTSDDTFADTAIEATDSSPTYIVATEGGRPAWEQYSAADIQQTTIEVEGVDDATDAAAEAEAMMDTHLADAETEAEGIAELGVTDWDYPSSWRKSPTPNRVILLKAWAGMDGSFSGCEREMRGEIGRTAPFCAAMKDRVLLTEQWR